VGAAAITRAFGARTGYPRELVDPTVRLDPDAVLAHFRGRVVGQDEATALLAQLVVTLKTNLADPARPLGSFLLLGPTGVGKTETALALAAYLFGDAKRLARFDMAEYAAPGSAQRLVAHGGAESSLARRVREQPFGVVLLDEIEKADGGVHDLLLQILGEGRLADAAGRTVSFRNTIVLLTSNLGADGAGRSLGFGAGSSGHDAHYRAAAAAFFRPELLNRFDQIVPYRPLGPEVIAQLARRALEKAVEREGLARRGVVVTWDEAVVTRLAELGFDPRLGARPLKRAVEEHVVAPLARLLAARSAAPPRRVRLAVRSGSVAVEAE
jgi:ATP-dependent Clp protease ATP-binding subunit ClpC